jgi:hypothetical protein
MIFEGHGDPGVGALLVNEGSGDYMFAYDVQKMMTRVGYRFDDKATIELKSCGSANPKANNVAEAFKAALPEAHVFGYTGLFFDLGPIEFGAPNLKPFNGLNFFTSPVGKLQNVPKFSKRMEVK